MPQKCAARHSATTLVLVLVLVVVFERALGSGFGPNRQMERKPCDSQDRQYGFEDEDDNEHEDETLPREIERNSPGTAQRTQNLALKPKPYHSDHD